MSLGRHLHLTYLDHAKAAWEGPNSLRTGNTHACSEDMLLVASFHNVSVSFSRLSGIHQADGILAKQERSSARGHIDSRILIYLSVASGSPEGPGPA